MPRCPSLKGKNGIGGPTVRLSLGRGAGRRAEHGHRTHRNTSPPFLQLGKCRPRAPGGPRGRSARCGNGLFAQCVRLRSEINQIRGCKPSKSKQNNRQNRSQTTIYRFIHEVSGRQRRVLGISMWCPINSITGVRMLWFYTCDGSPVPATQPRRSSSARSARERFPETRSWIQA